MKKIIHKVTAFLIALMLVSSSLMSELVVYAEEIQLNDASEGTYNTETEDTVSENTDETVNIVDTVGEETETSEAETELPGLGVASEGTETTVEEIQTEQQAAQIETAYTAETAAEDTEIETELDMSNVSWDDVPSMGWDDPENKKCLEQSAEEMTFDMAAARLASGSQKSVKAYGIDVSSHNGTIDWKKVKASGVDFAIIRVGGRGYEGGTIYKDDYAKKNIEGAIAAGIDVGVYFFSTALNEREALEEAKYTCSVIKGYNITYPVVYDHEGYEDPDYRNYRLSKATRTESAIKFLDYVESQGYKGMMYSSARHLQDDSLWKTSTLESYYDMWVAQYWISQNSSGKAEQFSSFDMAEKKPTSYTGEYRMWQFTSEGKVNGINDSYVDMDIEYYADGEITSLEAPEVYSAENASEGVQVTWGRVRGAAGYYIYRKSGSSGYSRIGQVLGGGTLSYTDSDAVSGTAYTYTVLAYNGSIKSNYNSEASVICLKEPGISEVRAVSGGIKVTWEETKGASGYLVYRKTNGGSWTRISAITSGSVLSYTDTSAAGGTSYVYTVRAYSGSAMSSYNSGVNIVYLKEPNVTGASAVSNGVRVAWEKVAGAAGYYIYRKTDGGNYSRIGQVTDGSTLLYTDTSAVSGTTYTYTALAYSGSSKSNYHSEKNILYLKYPNVTGVSTVSDGVKVTWEEISGAAGYYVYRKTNGGSWTRIEAINSGSVTSYTDTAVSSGTTYTYTVRACAGSAISAYNSQKSILYVKNSNGNISHLDAPKVASVVNMSNGIKVTWEEISGAAGYNVYRKTNGGSWTRIAIITGGTTLTYLDKSVSSGTNYTYTVRACAGNVMSSYDSQASLRYLKEPKITGTAVISGGVKLTWDKIAGAAGYNVYRKTNGGKWARIATIANGSTVTYTDKSVSSGTTYMYTVRAYAGSAMSSYKEQGKVLYLSVPALSGATITNSGVKIIWGKVTGASGYLVYRKTSGGSWSRIASVTNGPTVTYTDTTAGSGTNYLYTVRAYNGSYMSYYDTKGISAKAASALISYTTTDSVNYRTGPGTSYSIAGTLKKGVKVQVVSGYSSKANGYTWYKIYMNGKYYYIVSGYLKKV